MCYIKNLRKKYGDDWLILNATAVVITNEKNEVLLQKRSDSRLWGLPGGLLELDESIEQCAIREVKEETNLDIKIEKFLGVFTNPFMRWKTKDYAKVIVFALTAKMIDSELKVNDSESLELKYFQYETLPVLHSIDTIEIIDAYYHNIYNRLEGKKYDG